MQEIWVGCLVTCGGFVGGDLKAWDVGSSLLVETSLRG